MTVEIFDLEKVERIIIEWAKAKKCIAKVYIFGSRWRGYSKNGQPVRPDSDLDVALEFDKLPVDENCLTTWCGEADKWKNELSEILELKDEVKLDLTWPGLHVYQYLKDSSKLIYERNL